MAPRPSPASVNGRHVLKLLKAISHGFSIFSGYCMSIISSVSFCPPGRTWHSKPNMWTLTGSKPVPFLLPSLPRSSLVGKIPNCYGQERCSFASVTGKAVRRGGEKETVDVKMPRRTNGRVLNLSTSTYLATSTYPFIWSNISHLSDLSLTLIYRPNLSDLSQDHRG